ncbi:MAG: hypothetical protein QM820_32800 [Minicystis sp.]
MRTSWAVVCSLFVPWAGLGALSCAGTAEDAGEDVAVAAGAIAPTDQPRFHFVSFDSVAPGFFPQAIDNAGRVYGEFVEGDVGHAAVYAHGAVTVLQPDLPGAAFVVNAGGTAGGVVLLPSGDGFTQTAALYRASGVEIIPLPPGDVGSSVVALSDGGTAVVDSFDADFNESFRLYRNGQLGPPLSIAPAGTFITSIHINNQGILAGTLQGDTLRAYRFDTRTGELTLLEPIAGDPFTVGEGINNRGDVLGYSFCAPGEPGCTGDQATQERIGVWDRNDVFHTYFVEGNSQFPTISNNLLFNETNEIVITASFNDTTSYLVPRPGVRLPLVDLVDQLPPWPTPLARAVGMNNRGDIIGFGTLFTGEHPFLLERVGNGP